MHLILYNIKKPKTIFFHNIIRMHHMLQGNKKKKWGWKQFFATIVYIIAYTALQAFQCMYFLIQTKKRNISYTDCNVHTEYPCAAATEIMLNLARRGHVCRKVPRFLSLPCSRKAFKSRLIIAGHVSEEWRMKVNVND